MLYQNQKLLSQAQQLIALQAQLIDSGLKNKDIAKLLGLYPSAFSTLFNKILKAVLAIRPDTPDVDGAIAEIFSRATNVSEKKIRQNLGEYIEVLETFRKTPPASSPKKSNFLEQLSRTFPADFMRHLNGVFYCYYLSSFGYRIKKEPLLIQFHQKEEQCIVRKGNQRSFARYVGFGYLSNQQLFTLQIQEQETLVPDHFVAHFQLPPSYSSALNMLKGLSVSMSNAYLPIARKVILQRLQLADPVREFDDLETVFFEAGEGVGEPILDYLRADINYLEYLPIPYPSFDTDDLEKEAKVKGLLVR